MMSSVDPCEIMQKATQITANLRDYIDDDDEVTMMGGGYTTSEYAGFERPCVYISELACRRQSVQGTMHSSYAIELHKPYFEDNNPRNGEWQLTVMNYADPNDAQQKSETITIPLAWTGTRRFHVVLAEDAAVPLTDPADPYVHFQDPCEPMNTQALYGYNPGDYAGTVQQAGQGGLEFRAGSRVILERSVPSAGTWLTVDSMTVPDGWFQADGDARSIQRDISPGKYVRRLWASGAQQSTPALGNGIGHFVDSNHPAPIQAHPANRPLTNIGELGMILTENAYNLDKEKSPEAALINLADPNYPRLFNYLTVIDPSQHMNPDANDTRIMGRININTAPAFVLAQLPWLSYVEPPQADSYADRMKRGLNRARAIVDRRNTAGPYQSTGDLMQVAALRELGSDKAHNGNNDVRKGPDLTPDRVLDDLEERDLLFTRISDLVTVRSDVFTAYILVRIGVDGPQRRMIAIFDRSRVNALGDKVRLVALHPVPDPR